MLVVAVTVALLLRKKDSTVESTPPQPSAGTPTSLAPYHFETDPSDGAVSAEQMDRAPRQEQIEVVQHLVKNLPASANALFLLAMAYQAQGNRDDAARYLQQCLELQPQRADAHDQLGRIAQQEGEHEKVDRIEIQ